MYKTKVWYWDKDGAVQELEEICDTPEKAGMLITSAKMAMIQEENPDTFAKAKICGDIALLGAGFAWLALELVGFVINHFDK